MAARLHYPFDIPVEALSHPFAVQGALERIKPVALARDKRPVYANSIAPTTNMTSNFHSLLGSA